MCFRQCTSLNTYEDFRQRPCALLLAGLPARVAPRVGRFRTLQVVYLTSIIPPMRWHVQFRFDGSNHVTWHSGPEAALEAARLLIHSGVDVFGIGTGPLKSATDREYVDRLYELWSRVRNPLKRATG
jgi:hypothetical protein